MVGVGAVLSGAWAEADGLVATVPDAWLQGRTCYGGLSTALAYTAARRLADDLPPLRTATLSFVSPLAGEVRARAHLVRRGRSTAFVDADRLPVRSARGRIWYGAGGRRPSSMPRWLGRAVSGSRPASCSWPSASP